MKMYKKPMSDTSLSRRSLLRTAGAVSTTLALPAIIGRALAAEPLYINTWGGKWEESAQKYWFKPFTAKTGIEVRTISPVSFAKLAAQTKTGTYDFDITTVSGSQVVQAAEAKLLEPLNKSIIDSSSLPEGSVYFDAIASHCYSTNIAFNTKYFEPGRLQSWQDVWNLEKNPGPRSLTRSATDFVPIGLMGDGVAHDKLYPPDVDRLFRSLDKIKRAIPVWWSQSPQSRQLLVDGEVHATSMWHSVATLAKADGAPIDFTWNDGKINRVYWVISKGTPRANAAWEFIKFAIAPENLGPFGAAQSLGPLYPKALEYIPEQVARQLPTYPDNYKVAVEEDAAAIGPMLTDITKRFNMWVAS
ncbi:MULTISPECIES: extracellular solute-binding protein [unclassified Chelatococcus]|uniref:extracellular solute-binding protein n=1 Tax=unclassified Chelatococcus TaxID=2638111 RepID=UPI001BD0996F|nr:MULTISPECIES: extracellular solute-binding protein [unclassified Chelatococcus]MBS7696696.1 extracellular solute-binding protein [Chelatococcus sp. YT9]MBX3555261.1 extracellular solute-binding protein [Chelatococcus sp.]